MRSSKRLDPEEETGEASYLERVRLALLFERVVRHCSLVFFVFFLKVRTTVLVTTVLHTSWAREREVGKGREGWGFWWF